VSRLTASSDVLARFPIGAGLPTRSVQLRAGRTTG
jgi:hypothetical protein